MAGSVQVEGLQVVQFGPEVTPGTSVPATVIWRGVAAKATDDSEHVQAKENIGVSVLTTRQYTPKKLATLDLPTTEVTGRQFPLILDSAIKKATPTADGVGTGFIRNYATSVKNSTIPTVADLVTRTIECGANILTEKLNYGFVTEFEINGKVEEALKTSSKWAGQELVSGSFTTGLTKPSVSEFMFNKAKLFIDLASGTIGTTQIVSTLIAMQFKQTTGWKPRFTASGNLEFDYAEYTSPSSTIDLTFLLNANAVSQKANWTNNVPVLLRFQAFGKALTTPGTHTNEEIVIDVAGVISNFDDGKGADNGAAIVKLSVNCAYDPGADFYTNIKVVNEVAVMP